MSRYAKSFEDPQGPGDARPTALQIVEDEGLIGKLTDKVFLVTGVSAGIGVETMRALYATGGHVFGTVRNMEKGQKAVDQVKATTEGGKITLLHMANDDLASVRRAAEEFKSQSKTLNVLVNNAGIMATPQGKTKDGFELQFGTNHVSHFLLFQLLKDTLLASSAPDFPSRVVSVSSIGHRSGAPRPDDYNFEQAGSYEAWASYGQSKTGNIWLANEIERRYGSRGLHATSLHPGGIWTALQDFIDPEVIKAWKAAPGVSEKMLSVEQGAATSIYAALGEEWKNKGGKYLSNLVEMPPADPKSGLTDNDNGYASWAYDEEGARRLWKDSLKMVGLEEDV